MSLYCLSHRRKMSSKGALRGYFVAGMHSGRTSDAAVAQLTSVGWSNSIAEFCKVAGMTIDRRPGGRPVFERAASLCSVTDVDVVMSPCRECEHEASAGGMAASASRTFF